MGYVNVLYLNLLFLNYMDNVCLSSYEFQTLFTDPILHFKDIHTIYRQPAASGMVSVCIASLGLQQSTIG